MPKKYNDDPNLPDSPDVVEVPAKNGGPKEGDLVNVQFKVTAVYGDGSLRLESVNGVEQTGTIVGTKVHLKAVHPDVVKAA